MKTLSQELFAIGLSGVQPLDLSRHSQVVPLAGIVPVKPKPVMMPEPGSDAERDLIAWYDRPGGYSGD